MQIKLPIDLIGRNKITELVENDWKIKGKNIKIAD